MADKRKFQIEAGLDSSKVRSGTADAKDALKDLAQTAQTEGAKAGKGMDAVGAGAAGASDKVDKAARGIIGSIQRVTAATQAGEKGTAAYFEALAKQRGVSGDLLRPYLDQLRQVEQAQAKAQGTLNGMTISAGQMKAALRGVPAQFTDIVTSLASGQQPLTVFLQQGGQLKDVFGGAGAAAQALAGYIASLVTPFTAAAAAVAVLAYAYKQGSDEADAFRRSLVLTGNAAGTTVQGLTASAEAVSRSVGTQGKAAEVLAQLAATGRVAAKDLELLTEAAIRLEREGGPAVKETVEAFADLGKAPTQGALKLNESTRFLTIAVLEQIRALEEQGRVAEAAAVAQNAYAKVGIDRAKELQAALGPLERAWRDATDQARSFWDGVAGIGRVETAQENLAKIQSQLDILRQAGQSRFLLFGPSVDDLQAQRGAANRSLLNQSEGVAAARAAALVTEEYERARKANDKWAEAALTNTQKVDKALAEYRRNLFTINEGRAQAGLPLISAAEVSKQEEALRRSFQSSKKAADGYDLARESAKEWAKTIEDADKIQRDAENSTLGLSKAQARLIEYLISPAYLQNDAAMRQLAVSKLVAAHNAELLAKAERDLAKANEEVAKATRDNAAALGQELQAGEATLQSLRDQLLETLQGKDVLREQVLARLELAAAMNEQAAVQAMLDGLSAAEAAAFTERARQLREEVALRRDLASAAADADVRAANKKAAEDAQQDWMRASDQVGQALADALMQGGKSAAEYVKGLFRTMVLRPVIQSFVQPGANAALSLLGVNNPGVAGNGLMQQVQAASSLYGYGQRAYGAATGWLGVGSSSTAGAATAAQNIAFLEANGFTAAEAAQLLGGAAETYTTAGGVGSGASAGSTAWAGWVAAAVIAAMQGSSDFSAGFRREQAANSGTVLGDASARTADLFDRLGVSERIADLISGATLTARLFGRSAPRVEGQGITGSISGGDFTGNAFAKVVEKGGLFRSDRRSEVLGEVSTATAGFLDNAARNVLEQARAYGQALGLPVEALAGVQQQIRIEVTGKADEDLKALTDVLTGYGDALVAGYADAIAPLSGLNESTAATLQRVGAAIGDVNDVLQDLGLAALQASVDGGRAAVSLQDLFGGIAGLQQAAGSYLENYYTESERAALTTARLTDVLADFGLTLPTSRDGLRDLIEAQDRTTQSGREAFAALLGVSDAFAAITPSAEDLAASAAEAAAQLEEAARAAAKAQAELARSVSEGFAAVVGDFIGGDELARFRAGRIQSTLAGGGISVSVDGILASTEQDIIDLWRAVGLEGRNAILQAYDAWQELRQGVADGVQAQLDEITRVFGDLSVINEPVQTLSQSYVENRDRLRELETGLQALIGTAAKSTQEALADALQAQRSLQAFRGSLRDQIDSARLSGLDPAARVRALTLQEGSLFDQLRTTTGDPTSIAQRLTQVVLARIKEEADLRAGISRSSIEQARQLRTVEIDSLRQMVTAAERLRQLSIDIAQFTGSARFSDLSPLSYRDQLTAARGLFDTTASMAPADENAQRNLLGNAQAYLQELAAFTPVGTAEYEREWARVMGVLDSLGLQGQGAGASISDAQAQIDALERLNTTQEDTQALLAASSAETVAALTSIDTVLAGREEQNATLIASLTTAANQQIAELRLLVDGQAAQIRQQAAIAQQLTDTLQDLLGQDDAASLLVGARP